MGQVALLLLWEDAGGREDTAAALMAQALRGSPLHRCCLSSAVSHLPFWNIQALGVESPWTESPGFLAVPPTFHLSVFIPLSGRFTSIFYCFFFFFS